MKIKFFLALSIFTLAIFLPITAVHAGETNCFCRSNLDKVKNSAAFKKIKKPMLVGQCIDAPADKCTVANYSNLTKDKYLPDCERWDTGKECEEAKSAWDAQLAKLSASTGSSASDISAGPSSISDWIQTCGKIDDTSCRDVTVFVTLALDIIKYLFGIIGGLALAVFIYGGFKLIISQGNPEKVKEGAGAMINAVIGLAVAFSGYVLINFLATAIGVKDQFLLK